MELISRRRFLRSSAIAAGLTATGVRPSRALAQAGKPYAGTRLKMSQVSHAYGVALTERLPASVGMAKLYLQDDDDVETRADTRQASAQSTIGLLRHQRLLGRIGFIRPITRK